MVGNKLKNTILSRVNVFADNKVLVTEDTCKTSLNLKEDGRDFDPHGPNIRCLLG